jgi:hypothetical protein
MKSYSFISGLKQRPLAAVPKPLFALLALALALQLAVGLVAPRPATQAADLPPPPPLSLLRIASLGEPGALAKVLMLYLQAFDYQTGNRTPYQKLDYRMLTTWLGDILALDPAAQYPLHAASRLYAQIPNPAKQRVMLDFIYREYLVDPERRWPWLAEAALIAKHQLHDLPLALRYAQAMADLSTGPAVPSWVRQMRIFLLEDMSEFEQVRALLNGLLKSGNIHDPSEIIFLKQRLEALARQPQTPRP